MTAGACEALAVTVRLYQRGKTLRQQESEPEKEESQVREKLARGVDETDQQQEQDEKTGKQQEQAGAAEDEEAGLNKLKWDRLEAEGGGGSGGL
jgi:hypothetical protein